jgi:hypothetical protein
VPSSVWKALLKNAQTEQAMLDVVQWCWREKKVPPSWSVFYMTVLEKKGDLSNPANYRGMSKHSKKPVKPTVWGTRT